MERCVNDRTKNGFVVERNKEPADSAARKAIERLLAKWLVRAYLQKHGQADGEDDTPEVA